MPNLWTDDWESGPEDDWSGGGGTSKRLAGGERLGASLYELPPGGFVVEHFHHGAEELLLVLRGRPTLRTPDGERTLEEGDVVHFPRGPAGRRKLTNESAEPVRFVMAGTRPSPEVVEYPELGQVAAQSRHPSQTGDPLFVIHQLVQPDPSD